MAKNLGVANEYNIFVLGDHTQSNTDSEGRVAVKGNATYANYSVGSRLGTDTSRFDLIIGGDANIANGTNFGGNTAVSPSGTVWYYTMTNNNHVSGNPFRIDIIDFDAEEAYLNCASKSWSTQSTTGKAVVQYGGLTLTGTSNTLNIFYIDSANVAGSGVAMANLNKIDIVAPLTSTILINVSGISPGFGSYQIFRNGTTPSYNLGELILWNLYEAINILPSTTSILGSVLAPLATFVSGWHHINGNLIVKMLLGNIEAHNHLFRGELPPTACEKKVPNISIEKSSDKTFVKKKEMVHYTLLVTNTGTIPLKDVRITDDIPAGMTLIKGSEKVNGTPAIGSISTYIVIDEIKEGEIYMIEYDVTTNQDTTTAAEAYINSAVAVGKYKLSEDEDYREVSASASVTVDNIQTTLVKTCDKATATVTDVLTYTITFTNNSNIALTAVKIKDTIPDNISVITSSITPQPQLGETLATGITVGNVTAGGSATLTFKATVTSADLATLTNTSVGDYEFVDITGSKQTGTTDEASCTTNIVTAQIALTKASNKAYITPSDTTVIYTLVVTNTGSVALTDVVVTDVLPAGMAYQTNSTYLNNATTPVDINPEDGITIPALAIDESYKIVFTVTVVS